MSDNFVFGLDQLLNLSDNALLDLVLEREQPEGDLCDPRVLEVLEALRSV